MLQDRLIADVSKSKLDSPRIEARDGSRIYFVEVRQYGDDSLIPAMCLVGGPADEDMLRRIRASYHFSDNYGAVVMHKSVFPGVDACHSDGIIEISRNRKLYVVRGLLTTSSLRCQPIMKFYSLDHEGIVFASSEDFSGLSL